MKELASSRRSVTACFIMLTRRGKKKQVIVIVRTHRTNEKPEPHNKTPDSPSHGVPARAKLRRLVPACPSTNGGGLGGTAVVWWQALVSAVTGTTLPNSHATLWSGGERVGFRKLSSEQPACVSWWNLCVASSLEQVLQSCSLLPAVGSMEVL